MRTIHRLILVLAISSLVLLTDLYPQINRHHNIFYSQFNFNSDTIKTALPGPGKIAAGDTIVPPLIKDNFLVNSLQSNYGSSQYNLHGAVDGSGRSAFAWLDSRNGVTDIYAQFYDANGNSSGGNMKVNDSLLIGNNSPYVAANRQGDFVIIWLQNFSDVKAQRFTYTGEKIGEVIQVSSNYAQNSEVPSAAVNNDGSFLAAWAGEQGDWQFDVYTRFIDADGNPGPVQMTINDSNKPSTSIGFFKHAAVDSNGNYCVTWSSYGQGGSSKIYAQRLNRYGQLVGGNTLVSDPDISTDCIFPSVTSTADGKFLIAWVLDGTYPELSSVGTRLYNKDGAFISDIFNFNDSLYYYTGFNVSSDYDSSFYLLWGSYNNVQKIKSDGTLSGPAVTLIPPEFYGSYLSINGITDVINNGFYAAFTGYLRSDANVYIQKYDTSIKVQGSLKLLNNDTESASQKKPAVKFNGYGESIIIWEDSRNGGNDLYARVLNSDFNFVGEDIKLNETEMSYGQVTAKDIQAFSDGSFVIMFVTYGESIYKELRLQKVGRNGEKVGGNIMIKNDLYDDGKISSAVSKDDKLSLCFYNMYGGWQVVYNKNLVPASSVKQIITSPYDNLLAPFTVSIDSSLKLFAVWQTYEYNTQTASKILGSFYNENGSVDVPPFVIDSSYGEVYHLACGNEGNDYMLAYNTPYRLKIIRNYAGSKSAEYKTSINLNYPVSPLNVITFSNRKFYMLFLNDQHVNGYFANDNKRTSQLYKLHPFNEIDYWDNDLRNAAIYGEEMLSAYEDYLLDGTGGDIWANVRRLKDVKFDEEIFYEPASSDTLYVNYPNPFNSTTKITYQILAYHRVKLAIYDILGREVRVLVNQEQAKGIYEVNFNSAGLASGIYFCRLEAFDTSVRKLLLLK